jgi:hypothetical protein
MPHKTMIDKVRSTLFMFAPQIYLLNVTLTSVGYYPRYPAPARPFASEVHARRTSQSRLVIRLGISLFAVLHYGIGGLGAGATPQMADAHGGRGGVGISDSFPWVAAEPPVMQVPVKVSMLA